MYSRNLFIEKRAFESCPLLLLCGVCFILFATHLLSVHLGPCPPPSPAVLAYRHHPCTLTSTSAVVNICRIAFEADYAEDVEGYFDNDIFGDWDDWKHPEWLALPPAIGALAYLIGDSTSHFRIDPLVCLGVASVAAYYPSFASLLNSFDIQGWSDGG